MYEVIENTPGYLPDADEPASFDTLEEAQVYASDLLSNLLDSMVGSWTTALTIEGSFQTDRSVLVYDKARPHDLGRVIEIIEVA